MKIAVIGSSLQLQLDANIFRQMIVIEIYWRT